METYLRPDDRFAELICGLVMLLTFTAAGDLFGATGNELMIGATGCALAWGVIDGVTLILNSMFHRGWRANLVSELRGASADAGIQRLRKEFDEQLTPVVPTDARNELYASIMSNLPERVDDQPIFTTQMLYAGLGLVAIEGVCSLLVIIPILALESDATAIIVSNTLLVSALFIIGYRRAALAGWKKRRSFAVGLATMSVGLVLVVVAILMGG